MANVKMFYLIAAIVGTVLPWIPFWPFLVQESFSPYSVIQALYANGAASGLTNDFFISCVVFWVFVFTDAKRLSLRSWWFVMPAAPLIGLSMALPTYLFIREHQRPNNQ